MGGANSVPADYALKAKRLFGEKVVSTNESYWLDFWTYHNPTQEIINNALTPEMMDLLITGDPSNLQTVFSQLTSILKPETPTKTILHALYFIIRFAPYLFSVVGTKQVGTKEGLIVADALFLDENVEKEQIGAKLVSALLKLCFTKDFTVSSKATIDYNNLTEDLVWGNGIGTTKSNNGWRSSTGIVSNRIIVLKALIALCSQTLYVSPSDLSRMSNPFLTYLVSTELPQSDALFKSLLNSVCSFDPVGWGIPYNHIMYSERPEDLLRLCGEFLGIMLNHLDPKVEPLIVNEKKTEENEKDEVNKDGDDEEKKEEKEETETKVQPKLEEDLSEENNEEQIPFTVPNHNVFVSFFRQINSEEEFAFLYKGLTTHICNHLDANYTYLPFSKKSDECYSECLVLLWRFLQENKHFCSFLLEQPDCPVRVIVPILCYTKQGVKDPSGVGLLRLCEFLLLCLSENRMLGLCCNGPCPSRTVLDDISLVQSDGVTATVADAIIVTLSNMVTGNGGTPKPSILLESFLTVLTNISPFIKKITMQSANILVTLAVQMSRPLFLKSTDRSFLYLSLALEAINNLLLYQSEGNSTVLYTVLRSQKDFVNLSKLTYDSFLEKIEPKTPLAKQNQLQQQQAMLAKKKRIFKPTKEWFEGWKEYIPLDVIMGIIESIQPQLDKICQGDADDEGKIRTFLSTLTLVGIVPVPHPIVTRKQQFNALTLQWLTSYLWGVIFLNDINTYEQTNVKLFIVHANV